MVFQVIRLTYGFDLQKESVKTELRLTSYGQTKIENKSVQTNILKFKRLKKMFIMDRGRNKLKVGFRFV